MVSVEFYHCLRFCSDLQWCLVNLRDEGQDPRHKDRNTGNRGGVKQANRGVDSYSTHSISSKDPVSVGVRPLTVGLHSPHPPLRSPDTRLRRDSSEDPFGRVREGSRVTGGLRRPLLPVRRRTDRDEGPHGGRKEYPSPYYRTDPPSSRGPDGSRE